MYCDTSERQWQSTAGAMFSTTEIWKVCSLLARRAGLGEMGTCQGVCSALLTRVKGGIGEGQPRGSKHKWPHKMIFSTLFGARDRQHTSLRAIKAEECEQSDLPLLFLPCRIEEAFTLPFFFLLHVIFRKTHPIAVLVHHGCCPLSSLSSSMLLRSVAEYNPRCDRDVIAKTLEMYTTREKRSFITWCARISVLSVYFRPSTKL